VGSADRTKPIEYGKTRKKLHQTLRADFRAQASRFRSCFGLFFDGHEAARGAAQPSASSLGACAEARYFTMIVL
jgi:hypothetical protein